MIRNTNIISPKLSYHLTQYVPMLCYCEDNLTFRKNFRLLELSNFKYRLSYRNWLYCSVIMKCNLKFLLAILLIRLIFRSKQGL